MPVLDLTRPMPWAILPLERQLGEAFLSSHGSLFDDWQGEVNKAWLRACLVGRNGTVVNWGPSGTGTWMRQSQTRSFVSANRAAGFRVFAELSERSDAQILGGHSRRPR